MARWVVGGGGSYTDEQVKDTLGTTLQQGQNITVTVDDEGDTVTIAAPTAIVAVGTSASPLTNAATARPTGAAIVYWIMANGVTPTNAIDADLIFNKSA